MALTSLRSFTRTGVLIPFVGLMVLVPLPSWPNWLEPQAQTVPSFFSARVWLAPPVMACRSVPSRLLASTGTVLASP